MHDVFVSYARADRDRVRPLVDLLEANGLSVWWDAEVSPGSKFENIIDDALVAARLVIVVWTQESITSDWVQAEAGDGLERGILLPVLFDAVRIPVAFRRQQAIDLRGWPAESRHAELTQLLEYAVARVGHVQTTLELPKPDRRVPAVRVGWAAAVILGASYIVWSLAPTTRDQPTMQTAPRASILVLPFTSVGADTTDVRLAGVSFEIATILRRASALQVTSEQQVTSYLRELLTRPTSKLFTTHRLTGVLSPDGESGTRLDATLTEAASGNVAWQASFPLARGLLPKTAKQVADAVARHFNVPLPVLSTDIDHGIYLDYLKAKSDLRNQVSLTELEAANSQFARIIAAEPRFADAQAAYCRSELVLYRETQTIAHFENAEKHCHRANTLKRDDPEIYESLGALYRESGMLVESADHLLRALTLAPFSTSAMREMSQTLIRQGKFDDAEDQLRRALEIEPDYWLNYRELGRVEFMRGEYNEAATAYRMESELVSDNAQALNNLGAAYFLGERFDEAIAAWEGIKDLDQNGRVLSNLGSAYYFRRDFDRAAMMFARAIDVAPQNHEYWSGLGEALRAAGSEDARPKFERALELASGRLAINPNDPLLLSAIATYQAALGDEASARESVRRLEALGTNDVYAMYDIARTYARLGRPVEARAAVESLVAMGYSKTLLALDANFDDINRKGDGP